MNFYRRCASQQIYEISTICVSYCINYTPNLMSLATCIAEICVFKQTEMILSLSVSITVPDPLPKCRAIDNRNATVSRVACLPFVCLENSNVAQADAATHDIILGLVFLDRSVYASSERERERDRYTYDTHYDSSSTQF